MTPSAQSKRDVLNLDATLANNVVGWQARSGRFDVKFHGPF
jgi:hypothetical protein